LITLSNLIKDYKTPSGSLIRALQIKELNIDRGRMLGISGVSGSGKTTLLHIITGLLLPTEGNVYVNGENINSLSESKRDKFRAAHIGYIFQNFNLIPYLTAKENILLSIWLGRKSGRKERETRCDELLERVGLSARAGHLPGQLSGGEQQRICIARAIANSPEIVVADEPTANLDSRTKLAVTDLIREVCRQNNTTLIVSSHDKEILQKMDDVFHLDSAKEGP
jgi:putative ABC transport system ATP-binding protein